MSDHVSRQAIAIVGMACRMPGADNLAEFWDLVRTGGQAFGPLPEDRLNRDLFFHPEKGQVCKTYTDLGGIVSRRPYDHANNPIPPKLYEQLDPAHRILFEVAADACRDAGYDPYNLAQRRAGVYIGHTGGSELVSDYVYSTIVEEGAHLLDDVKAFKALGPKSGEYLQQVIAETRKRYPGRKIGQKLRLEALTSSALISEVFGLNGPYMVVDAACASSLQAMSAGIRALREGRIDMAFAGGASYCKSDSLVLFSAAQSVSTTGSCPFSAQADGLVSAEGYVILILKTLEKAVADKDQIHAVISGIGVSSDGRGRSLWAPRKEGQILAVQRAYGEHHLDPRRLQYIEAHATSTQVGDATELHALSESMSGMLGSTLNKIPIGSVKGNIGHTLETAGMAGIVKTVLAMKHKTIPPVIKGEELNSDVDWTNCPFHVPFSAQPWPAHADGHPRRAAVNAFGIGGLNVHVVLDEFQPQHPTVRRLNAERPVSGQSVPTVSSANNPDDQAIAIIGMGCILPGARTLQAFWDLLLSERDALTIAPRERIRSDLSLSKNRETWKINGNFGGFIHDYTYDWRKHKIPPKQIANANPLQFMLLDAADQALKNAGLTEQNMDTQHTAVMVGTMFGGDFTNHLQMGLRLPEFQRDLEQLLSRNGVPAEKIAAVAAEYQQRLFEKMPAMLDETGSFTSSTLASRITKAFNLMGGAMAIDAGSCSSLLSIQAAVDMLRQRDANVVVCAAGQRSMDVWVYECYSRVGLLPSGKPGAAFSENGNGTVPGEGCGVIVLKRLSDARRDGNPIQAVIRGIGAAANNNARLAIHDAAEQALREAQIPATAVEAIEMQGTGLADIDPLEFQATRQIYTNPELGRNQPLQLSTLRSQIGDLGGAAGMVSVIKAALSATAGTLPGTVGFDNLDPRLGDGKDANFAPSKQQIPVFDKQGYRAMAVTNTEDRMAYHLILDNGQPKPDIVMPAVTTPAESTKTPPVLKLNTTSALVAKLLRSAPQLCVYRFASPTRASLLEQVSAAAKTGQLPKSPAGDFLLNLVASSPEELSKKLSLAAEGLRSDRWNLCLEQGVFFRDPNRPKSRIAFLFPGQGSQYHGMFELLTQNFAPMAEASAEANTRMREQGYPTFAELAGSQTSGLGSDVWQTQISMLLADYMAWKTITALGVAPDYVAGHSFGEFAALMAAGVWTLPETIRATRSRCDAVANCQTAPSAMVSLLTTRAMALQIIAAVSDDVWLCAENSPQQCVIGGTDSAVDRVLEYCTTHRITAKRLRVPCAFHTPLLDPTQEPLRAALDQREMHLPCVPFMSATYARFLADPADFRDSLVDQMTHPVEFVSVIQKLRAMGVDTFLEIGPSQVLTQLTRKILQADSGVRCLALDQADSKSPEALIRMILALETWGLINTPPTIETAQPQSEATTQPVNSGRAKPAPKYVDATEARRARMRMASRDAAPGKSESKPSKPVTLPAAADMQHESKAVVSKSNGATNTHNPVENGTAQNGHYTNGHSANGHNGNGHQSNFQKEHSGNRNGKHLDESSKKAVTPLPENWTETLAWLQDQALVRGLRGELAAQLEMPWAKLGFDAHEFLDTLRNFYELSTAELRQMNHTQTVAELCRLLCENPGKSAWLSDAGKMNSNRASSADLAQFLTQFVVDQTGYPDDMVDLDADLEADLGIDSIKKAQLFGEVGERFALTADPNLSLDDFPTLRHVLSYIEEVQTSKASSSPNGRPSTPAKSASVNVITASSSATPSLNSRSRVQMPSASPVRSFESTSQASTALLDEPAIVSEADDTAEIVSHLINFVIDQTGYPEEMVDLDADLEADLGIDSIKKAQLFGEIGERFSLSADPNLSLDDFPSLRQVLAYIVQARSLSVTSPKAAPTTVPVAPPLAQVQPAAMVASTPIPQGTAAPAKFGGQDQTKLAEFLVEFVVDQTGYPEEMVELDADLEADLGIDSIKKAQLFGEIGEQFNLSADPNLTLDDFPTLRHVLKYVLDQQSGLASELATPTALPKKKSDTPDASSAVELSRLLVSAAATDLDEFFSLGFRRGQTAHSEIRQAIRRHAHSMSATTANAGQIAALTNLLTAEEQAEIQGLADGSGILVESLQALNFAGGALGGTEIELSLDKSNSTLCFRGFVPVESAPLLERRTTPGGAQSYEWSIPGYLGCLTGVSQHGISVTVQIPSTTTEVHALPVPIIAARVLRGCRTLSQACEFLANQRVTPNAALTISDIAANQAVRFVADAYGKLSSTAPTELPSSLVSQVQTASAQRRIQELAAIGTAAPTAHWIRLVMRENTAQHHRGDQWQTAATPRNQTIETIPFSIPQPRTTRTNVPVARQLSAIQFPAGLRITHRFLPRLVISERTNAKLTTKVKLVAILGHEPTSQALATTLRAEGFEVTVFAKSLGAAQILERLEQSGPCHLVLSATDEYSGTTTENWHQQSHETLLTSFAVCQSWLVLQQAAGVLDQVSLTGLTSLGGTFGFAPAIINPLGGGLAGFCKGLRNEQPMLRVKLIDTEQVTSPAEIARIICAEWLSADNDLEVALRGNDRRVVRYIAPELPPRGESIPHVGDQWIVTGGARGITAVVAREMAARYGLHLNILGSTDLSGLDLRWLTATAEELKAHKSDIMRAAKARGADAMGAWKDFEKTIEIAKNLQILRDAGLAANYFVCDVSNWNSLEQTLATIRTSGPIRGIMHGAGFEAAAKFEKKKLPNVERTIQVKAGGAAALIALTENDPLGWFIGFGSTSGRFGGVGQTDYSLANDLLAKQVSRLREQRPECRTVTVHWHAWGEIGMAARPESKFALEAFGLRMMPPGEGISYLLTEIDAGLPEREIVITEDLFVPPTLRVDEAFLDLPVTAGNSSPTAAVASSSEAASSSMISEIELQTVLVDFVVEQTGYPVEMVELDADLEADLGIDSIKKAQLFGEIGERFQLSADPNLSLDDFPTLRHVLCYVLEQNGEQVVAASPSIATASQNSVGKPADLVGAAPKPFLGPLLEEVRIIDAQRHQAIATLDPVNDVFLTDHRMNGRPLMPGTFGWALLAQAAAALEPGKSVVRLTNVNIHNPLAFADETPRTVRVNCLREGTRWLTESTTAHMDRNGRVLEENRPLMTAEVEFSDQPPTSDVTFTPAIFPLNTMVYPENAEMYHGKNLRTCQTLLYQHGGGWGKLKNFGDQATAGTRRLDGWILPAGLLDGAIVSCAVFSYLMCGGRVEIPHGIDELILFREPRVNEVCMMQFRFREIQNRNSWFDFELFGEENRLLVTARGLRLITLG